MRYVIQPLDLQEALHRIIAACSPVSELETVNLDHASGRVLAEDQIAQISLPPFPSSAMDGYALIASGRQAPFELDCIGESLAGHPYDGALSSGQCVHITTGACVPADADAVIPQEDCQRDGGRVHIQVEVEPGENVRQVGNDIQQGNTIVPSGQSLRAFDVAWLAACGVTSIHAYRLPRVAVFSTGDELLEPGKQLAAGQIYDSNREVLKQLLKQLPAVLTDLGVLPDDPAAIEHQLATASRQHDLILTTGGVSVGSADYVRDVVSKIGQLDIWRLNLKPGKPLAFGRIANSLFVGLPGNPVSTIVTFLLIAKPLLMKLAGGDPAPPHRFRAMLVDAIIHRAGREEYQRGHLHLTDDTLEVAVTGEQGSNRLATFGDADCLIRIPKEVDDVAKGSIVEVLPFSGLVS